MAFLVGCNDYLNVCMILLPLTLFLGYILPQAMIFPFPLQDLIFFPNRLHKLPHRVGGNQELYTPLALFEYSLLCVVCSEGINNAIMV